MIDEAPGVDPRVTQKWATRWAYNCARFFKDTVLEDLANMPAEKRALETDDDKVHKQLVISLARDVGVRQRLFGLTPREVPLEVITVLHKVIGKAMEDLARADDGRKPRRSRFRRNPAPLAHAIVRAKLLLLGFNFTDRGLRKLLARQDIEYPSRDLLRLRAEP